MSNEKVQENYGTAVEHITHEIPLPPLPYQPQCPADYRPKIGLIGCGGITEKHLQAYQKDGLEVVMLCDKKMARAEARRDQFYPSAEVTTDYRDLLNFPEIEVLDIATQPVDRPPIIEDALRARKHVLSQKPFVLDLATGERLANLAREQGVKLAVNQNGRWAPYFSYLRQAVASGYLGNLATIEMALAWDHSWIKGTPFETVEHIMLFDFAIHWFDICSCLLPTQSVRSVYALESKAHGQPIESPMVTSVMLDYGTTVATMSFNGFSTRDNREFLRVVGDRGAYTGQGKIIEISKVELAYDNYHATGILEGEWFPDGMRGAIGELLTAIQENRDPSNSAESALQGLRLCFAAIESARQGRPINPAEVTAAGPGCLTA
jgi:predicted dehydrogenase